MITKIKRSFLTRFLSITLALNILGLSSIYANNKVTLYAGTAIILETVSIMNSATLMPGQSVDLKVKYDVMVDNKVVIAAGTIAKGQIKRTQMAKGLGKPGHIEVMVNNVTAVDGSIVPLAGGNLYEEGEDRQTTAIVLGVLICILFLTQKGKNAEVPAGTQINATSAGTIYVGVE